MGKQGRCLWIYEPILDNEGAVSTRKRPQSLREICLANDQSDRHIAVVCALATILAFAFDPFNQALLRVYQENIED